VKRVRVYAGMGFSGATYETEYTYSDEEFEDVTEDELYELADEFAQQYVEAWFEIEDA
jgi:hypothetical protein